MIGAVIGVASARRPGDRAGGRRSRGAAGPPPPTVPTTTTTSTSTSTTALRRVDHDRPRRPRRRRRHRRLDHHDDDHDARRRCRPSRRRRGPASTSCRRAAHRPRRPGRRRRRVGRRPARPRRGFRHAHTRRSARRVTTTDRFRIASISKVITATVVLQLVDAGFLRLDEPVGQRLAGIVGVPAGNGVAAVTVRQLLSHTSGFPDYRGEFFGDRFAIVRAGGGIRAGAFAGSAAGDEPRLQQPQLLPARSARR